ncbi:MAG: histidine phosphatase family protein [Leptolyngbya sp. SIO4C1]|nr:histidine phosphatase family protein [Leptolyngbya sp. SIO4C1]
MLLLKQETTVILVRHGRSTYNDQGRYQGSSDEAELTPLGCETAQQVGKWLQHETIHAVYASPLKRAQQTANAILKQQLDQVASLTFSDDLREMDLPAWQGLPYQTVRETFAADYRCWLERPHEFQMEQLPQSGSALAVATRPFYPVRSLYERAQQFWQTVLPRHVGQTLLVVSHGGTIHALISTALGLSPASHHCLQQSNCGVSCLKFNAAGAQLCSLNDTTGIGETSPKLKAGKRGLRLLFLPISSAENDLTAVARLKTLRLDFYLHVHNTREQQINSIALSHPNAVGLQVDRADFLEAWRITLSLRKVSSELLMTGLVIAPMADIQKLLSQLIGLSDRSFGKLVLALGTLSVLHFPASQQRPILQAMNLR